MKVIKTLSFVFLISVFVVACAPGSASADTKPNGSSTTMELTSGVSAAPVDPGAVDITRDPTDLPVPLGQRGPEKVRVDLVTSEISGLLADGTSYRYWTFDGKVPGPMIRVRVGDTVELHLKNDIKSLMAHSIDLHAVTGPAAARSRPKPNPVRKRCSPLKRSTPGCSFTTARPPWWRTISPTGCTA